MGDKIYKDYVSESATESPVSKIIRKHGTKIIESFKSGEWDRDSVCEVINGACSIGFYRIHKEISNLFDSKNLSELFSGEIESLSSEMIELFSGNPYDAIRWITASCTVSTSQLFDLMCATKAVCEPNAECDVLPDRSVYGLLFTLDQMNTPDPEQQIVEYALAYCGISQAK